jgi:hypothetical protein
MPYRTGSRLPEQVFLPAALVYCFCEFDEVLTGQFWVCAGQLAQASQDTAIIVTVLDSLGASAASTGSTFLPSEISIAADAEAEYLTWLVRPIPGQHEQALVYTAEIILFRSPSKSWAIWAQRDMEVAVLAVFDEKVASSVQCRSMKWLPLTEAMHNLIALRYPDQTIPSYVREALVRNYACAREL